VHQATITVSDPDEVSPPQTIAVTLTLTAVQADFDGDGDVDQSDFGHLQDCYSGPGVPQNESGCTDARLDGDEDVDAADFGIFQGCMGGEGQPVPPGCTL